MDARYARVIDILKEFLTDTAEILGRLDDDLVGLEREPADTERLHAIFRGIHTIKGTCGFLDLPRLERVSHAAESVLDDLRARRLTVGPEIVSDLLAAIDIIRQIVTELERSGSEPAGDDAPVLAALDRWVDDARGAPATATAAACPVPTAAPAGPDAAGDGPGVATVTRDAADAAGATALRVHVSLLDTLMNLAGELVLARNQLLLLTGGDPESCYAAPVQQLDRITAELQDAVMRTRLQPVGTAWSKLPRIVRDIAHETGKQIELEMRGAATELDRQLVQALQDPLTHMVRNSADHGIEAPDARTAAGKEPIGRITLDAYHEGGHVIVELRDDGAGIDAARVRRRAVERGLVRDDVAASLTDQQVLRFVFEPGFSTADTVTHLSGRGVGMDVVRSNIERVGGTVDLQSSRGRGTLVRIRLPLTLAVVPALLVDAGGDTFALPQSAVRELVRVTGDARARFDALHGARLLRLRDALIPVVDLCAALRLDARADGCTVVVCQLGDLRFGVVVDEVLDTHEIVVKPVGRRIRHLVCYAGCTILGDGRTVMILDPAGLATLGRVSAMPSQQAPAVPVETGTFESLLLFDGGTDALQAVPLRHVARLEEIPGDRLERAEGRVVTQYGGTLLPVVPAGAGVTITAGRSRAVIVLHDGTTSFGLAVNEIHDIVEDRVELALTGTRPDVLGTAVVAGRAVEVIDPRFFFARARAGRPVS